MASVEGYGAAYANQFIHESSTHGRGLFAVKDHEPGECLVIVPHPLVTALDNRRLKDTCANCYEWTADVIKRQLYSESKPPNLQVCAGCKTLKYCCKKCQAQSWKREHKHICKLLGKLNQKGTLPNAARAVLRMLQLAAEGLATKALMDMKSHLNEITARGGERAETLLVMSTGIHEYSGTPLGVEYVQNFFAVVLTNSLTVWTPTMDPLGIAVDPLASKANHSCDPNAVAVWDAAELEFRSLRPIKKGEEIFISYIDPTQPYSRRQRELDEKFYFKCKCLKCKLQWSGPNDYFLETPKLEKPYSMFMMTQSSREDIVKPILEQMTRSPITESDADFLGTKVAHSLQLGDVFKGVSGLSFAQKYAYAAFKASTAPDELEQEAVLQTGLEACVGTKAWPDDRQPLPMIRHNALCLQLLMMQKNVENSINAFKQALKLYFDCHPRMYPQTFHPIRLVNKWTIVELAFWLASGLGNSKVQALKEEGVDFGVVIFGFMTEVQDNVQLSFGKNHRFTRFVLTKVEQLRIDMTRGDTSKMKWAESQVESQWNVLRKLARSAEVNRLKIME